jgi:hypothetical protein
LFGSETGTKTGTETKNVFKAGTGIAIIRFHNTDSGDIPAVFGKGVLVNTVTRALLGPSVGVQVAKSTILTTQVQVNNNIFHVNACAKLTLSWFSFPTKASG